ncbi:MAG: phosphatase PAP2 family protein [Fibrobacterota bacterium]|nr:phosphatase PAP2 family protein [Fibrobacterota bacterium]
MTARSNLPFAAILLLLILFRTSPAVVPQPDAQIPAPAILSSGILALGYQDVAWISAAVLTAIPAQIRYNDMPPADTGSLDRQNDLWLMDRWAAGLHSPKAALASNLTIYVLVGLPMAVTAWDSYQGRQTWSAAISEAVVYAEAMAIASSLTLLVRSTQVHPRPLVYGRNVPADERLSGEASGSFYSGHANGAFLSAVFFAYTHSLRNPDSENKGWIWAGSLGAASMVAGLRVAAGKHFLSDVLVGAATGSFFGWAFPRMHLRPGAGVPRAEILIDGDGVQPVLTWTF